MRDRQGWADAPALSRSGPRQLRLAGAVLVGGARPLQVLTGKVAFLDKPDLMYVRELLPSTEALCKEVAARMAEARRLQDQARALHSQDTHPHPPKPTEHKKPRQPSG